ncbi:MAG: DNA polymerase III alpha subunit, partial [uncultured Acidimicrobiales bacterium]
DRLPPRPAQAGGRQGPRGGAGRHPVRDARGRGPRPAEDGLPRPAQPRRDQRHGGADRAGARHEARHRRHPARRRGDALAAAPGRLDGGVPAGGRPHAGPRAQPRPHQLRRRRRPRGPLPARSDGSQHAQRLRRSEERPQAHHLPAPRRRGGAGRHLRAAHLPGAGDAPRPALRRLLPGRGRQPPQGVRQEAAGPHRRAPGDVRRRVRGDRVRPGARRRLVRHHRAVRRLRLPQEPLLRLRARVVPDRLPQGEPPGRVPGVPARLGQGRPGPLGHLPGRVPAHGDRGARPRRQPLRAQLHRPLRPVRGRSPPGDDPLRAGGRAQRGGGAGAAHPGRARARAVPRLPRLLRPGRPPGAQQAGARVAHQGGRLRQPRPRAPGAAHGVRAGRRPGPHPSPGARRRGDEPLRGGGRRRGLVVRRAHRHPHPHVRQDAAPRLREGDARPLRERPPAHGRRAPPRPPRRLHDRRAARHGRRVDPRWRRRVERAVDAHGRWGRDRPPAQAHEEGRPHGDLRARGPGRRHRGDGVPEDDGRPRPQARRRRGGLRQGPPRHQGRHPEADRDGDHAHRADPRRGHPAAHQGPAEHARRRRRRPVEGPARGASRGLTGVPPRGLDRPATACSVQRGQRARPPRRAEGAARRRCDRGLAGGL